MQKDRNKWRKEGRNKATKEKGGEKEKNVEEEHT